MASQRASGSPLRHRDAAAWGTEPASEEQGGRRLAGSPASEGDGKGRTGPSAGAWGGAGEEGTNTSIFHQALAARGLSRAQASNAPRFLPAEPSGPVGMDLPPLSSHQPFHRHAASALAASLLRQMQEQPAMRPQPQPHSQSRSPSESFSQSQPQRPLQPRSQSHPERAGDVPSALEQLFRESLSQQGQMSQQGHGHLGQQRYLQQETLLGQSTAPASFTKTISPSMLHSTMAFSAPSLPCAEGAPSAGGNLASPAAAAALSNLLTANPSLRALLSAFGYGEAGGSQHGASEEGGGNFEGPSAQGLEGEPGGQDDERAPGIMALMDSFELPSLPEMLQASERPDLAALGMRLPMRPHDEPLGAAPRALPSPGGLFKGYLESAVLGMLDPALEAHAGEGRFSPAPGEGRALGQEAQGGLAASRSRRTGQHTSLSVQEGGRSLLGGSGPEASAQGMMASHPRAFQAPGEEEDEQPIGRGPDRELKLAVAGALGGGAAPGMGSGEADARGRGVDCMGETEDTLLRAAGPRASAAMQDWRAGLGARPMEELEGSGGDSQSTPGEGKLSTKGVVEKRRRERISNAFAELRAEMDIHGDMATVLMEAKRLVKKQKALIQNLQKQVYIHHVLKSSQDMLR